jgi:hypothetical protein
MKREVPRDPKTDALMRILQISRREAVGILELLFHFTAKFAPQGDIGKYRDLQIEGACYWEGEDCEAGKLIPALVASGYLAESPEHGLTVVDWQRYADVLAQQQRRRMFQKVFSTTYKQNEASNPLQVIENTQNYVSSPDRSAGAEKHIFTENQQVTDNLKLHEASNSTQVVANTQNAHEFVGGGCKGSKIPVELPVEKKPMACAPSSLMTEWPLTAIEIRKHFPAISDFKVLEGVQMFLQTFVSNASPGAEEPFDKDLALAVRLAHWEGMKYYGELCRGTSQVIKTWIERSNYEELRRQRNGRQPQR